MGLAAFVQVLLMILLCSPELRGRFDRGNDWLRKTAAALKALFSGFGGGFLLR